MTEVVRIFAGFDGTYNDMNNDLGVLGTQCLIMMEHRYGAASTSYFT